MSQDRPLKKSIAQPVEGTSEGNETEARSVNMGKTWDLLPVKTLARAMPVTASSCTERINSLLRHPAFQYLLLPPIGII